MKLNHQLIKNLGLSWSNFLIVGLLISWFFPIPQIDLLIDRSYCPSPQWEQLVRHYEELYQQHQSKALRIESVILVNDLGAEKRSPAPKPDELRQISTYGRLNPQKLLQVRQNYSQAQILSCDR
jgi:hypothetical protein